MSATVDEMWCFDLGWRLLGGESWIDVELAFEESGMGAFEGG